MCSLSLPEVHKTAHGYINSSLHTDPPCPYVIKDEKKDMALPCFFALLRLPDKKELEVKTLSLVKTEKVPHLSYPFTKWSHWMIESTYVFLS